MDADFCRKVSGLLASTYIIKFPTIEVYSGSDVCRAKYNRYQTLRERENVG
jgi:hypothetical protein